MGTGKPPDGEELAALQGQLADARAEVERVQREAEGAAARAREAIAEAAAARRELLESRDAAAAALAQSDALGSELESAGERERAAAERYRELVVRSEPALPAELIAGESIDAIEASVDAARALVGRVRSQLEAQAQAGRVPAGAPPRSGPDMSALTPEQKIRYGLAQRG